MPFKCVSFCILIYCQIAWMHCKVFIKTYITTEIVAVIRTLTRFEVMDYQKHYARLIGKKYFI